MYSFLYYKVAHQTYDLLSASFYSEQRKAKATIGKSQIPPHNDMMIITRFDNDFVIKSAFCLDNVMKGDSRVNDFNVFCLISWGNFVITLAAKSILTN